MRFVLLLLFIFIASCASQRSPEWTAELTETTQQSFDLAGEWQFTARSGAEFGRRCDYLFERDGSYRKSCRPPVEEAGDWEQVGEWNGHSFRIRLSDRFDLIEKRELPDTELDVVVQSPAHREITVAGELFLRQ